MNKLAAGMAALIEKAAGDPDITGWENRSFLEQALCATYAAETIQPAYCRLFQGMTKEEIGRVLTSFAFDRCRPNKGLIEIVSRHMTN
jgi:hypothetical protein